MPKGLSPEAQAAYLHGGGAASSWINKNANTLQAQYAADLAKQKEKEKDKAAYDHRMGEHTGETDKVEQWKELARKISEGPVWEPSTPGEPQIQLWPPVTPDKPDLYSTSCEIIDEIDPNSPSLERTETDIGVGQLIDQAAIAMQQTPPTGNVPFEIARVVVNAVEFVKNKVSTGYNIVCQQIQKEGPYYEIFPIDKKISDIGNQWNSLSTTQKITFIGVSLVAIIFAVPVIVMLI